jgi:hypothetical protein
MPEEYNKLAEGIVKGSVPMVASFVERYVSDDEPGFFVGDREHVEGDIRVHVTVFGQMEQSNSHLTDSIQLGVVDLQQLPDGRVWMVVGTLPTLAETEAWLSDLYSAMVRRMAARLVQFGFLDAPNRPRLRAASTMALTQVAQALKPPKPAPAPQPTPARSPEAIVKPAVPVAQAAESPRAEAQAAAPVRPSAATATPAESVSTPAASAAPIAPTLRAVPSPAALAAMPPTPSPNLFSPPSFPQLDLVLTIAMVFIWVAACGLLFYLLTLLLK